MIEDQLQKLGERLLSYEPTDSELGERYRKEISAMLYRGPGIRRRVQIIGGSFLVVMAVVAGAIAYFADSDIPVFARWIVAMFAVYQCIFGVFGIICAVRRVDPRRYRGLWFGPAMVFMLLLVAMLLAGSRQVDDVQLRWQLTVAAFVLLGFLGVATVIHFIEEYHKRTEMKLLELEYRLADLVEKMKEP